MLHLPSLLVADNGYQYQAVLQFMPSVPSHEGLHTVTHRVATHIADPRPAVAIIRHGLHGPIAEIEWSQLLDSCDRLFHVTGTLDTYKYTGDCQRSHLALCQGDCQTPWNAQIYCV